MSGCRNWARRGFGAGCGVATTGGVRRRPWMSPKTGSERDSSDDDSAQYVPTSSNAASPRRHRERKPAQRRRALDRLALPVLGERVRVVAALLLQDLREPVAHRVELGAAVLDHPVAALEAERDARRRSARAGRGSRPASRPAAPSAGRPSRRPRSRCGTSPAGCAGPRRPSRPTACRPRPRRSSCRGRSAPPSRAPARCLARAARAAKSRMPWASEVRSAAGSGTWRVARSCGTSSSSRLASATSGFSPTSGSAASGRRDVDAARLRRAHAGRRRGRADRA